MSDIKPEERIDFDKCSPEELRAIVRAVISKRNIHQLLEKPYIANYDEEPEETLEYLDVGQNDDFDPNSNWRPLVNEQDQPPAHFTTPFRPIERQVRPAETIPQPRFPGVPPFRPRSPFAGPAPIWHGPERHQFGPREETVYVPSSTWEEILANPDPNIDRWIPEETAITVDGIPVDVNAPHMGHPDYEPNMHQGESSGTLQPTEVHGQEDPNVNNFFYQPETYVDEPTPAQEEIIDIPVRQRPEYQEYQESLPDYDDSQHIPIYSREIPNYRQPEYENEFSRSRTRSVRSTDDPSVEITGEYEPYDNPVFVSDSEEDYAFVNPYANPTYDTEMFGDLPDNSTVASWVVINGRRYRVPRRERTNIDTSRSRMDKRRYQGIPEEFNRRPRINRSDPFIPGIPQLTPMQSEMVYTMENFNRGRRESGQEEIPPERYEEFNFTDINIPVMPGRRRSTASTSRRRRPTRYAERQWRTMDSDYIVKNNPAAEENTLLDLDCLRHPEREIDGFGRRMKLIMVTNPTLAANLDSFKKYLEYHMRGNARFWYQNSPHVRALDIGPNDPPNQDIKPTTSAQYIDRLIALLYNEFTGKNEINASYDISQQTKSKAEYMLINTRLCDMCDFPNFVCYYQKWLLMLDFNKQIQYTEQFFKKLPPAWMKRAEEGWAKIRIRNPNYVPGVPGQNEYMMADGTFTDNLAGRVRLITEYIESDCSKQVLFNEFTGYQNQPCCNPSMYTIPIQFGCGRASAPARRRRLPTYKYEDPRYRRRPRRRRRYRRRYPTRYKRRRRNVRHYKKYSPKKRTYFRKRRRYTRNKQAYCPTGKKTCKCWICQEEGHYANECPNKKKGNFKEKAKKLEIIEKIFQMTPIEDDYFSDDNESVYSIESDYSERSFDTDPGSEWELIEDDEEDDLEFDMRSLQLGDYG